ncbi:MAG: TldD/PmbA family protein [Candidatus Hydrothermia bacterium]|jgi:TldD protein|nr:TldD/PmbA family protein [Candidatus Hydrothermia bacterium]
MKEITKMAIEMLKDIKEIDYGDVRLVIEESEIINYKNGEIENVSRTFDIGIGIRVMFKGFWGFSSTNDLSTDSIYKTIKKAVNIAKSSYIPNKGLKLTEEDIYTDEFFTKIEIDPFSIPIDEKIKIMENVDKILRSDSRIKIVNQNMSFIKTEKFFASTEGAFIHQIIYHSGGGYTAYAFSDEDVQFRSYPAAHGGNMLSGGFEIILNEKWEENAYVVKEELLKLLYGKKIEEGEYDIIIGTNQMALQIHESVGHALELDRVFGFEASYAGTSWADKIGIKFGSEYMNIVQDGTIEKGLGSFGYDDDGVKSKKEFLIKEGILVNYLSSRDSAWLINKKSTGASRASSYNRIPIVRMTNVNLLPGDKTLEELISDIKDGFYLETNKSWSIDQKRLNFQFSTEIAYKIKNGKLLKDEVYKNPVYYGISYIFWNNLDGVANENYWKLWGVPNCGKGEPGQTARVGHGSSPCRFRKVKVFSV